MQSYGRNFARIYDKKWSSHAKQIAQDILDFYASTGIARTNKSVLDVCCGAGHLAVHFLENGYDVVGIDLSENMLHFARGNASRYIESGQCRFINADASAFELSENFGLVVSTYDSLNHLRDEQALINCFKCVYAVNSGYFIFDLNTRKGLKRWNSIQIDDSDEDALIISRGIFDGKSDRAWIKLTGFVRNSSGLYERFEETVYNTVFSLDWVRKVLNDVGWTNVHFARIRDLSTPLAQPEDEGRVFVVASL
jgi:ubiquinone/menaquinone biosynthesis C-methylase UbiE